MKRDGQTSLEFILRPFVPVDPNDHPKVKNVFTQGQFQQVFETTFPRFYAPAAGINGKLDDLHTYYQRQLKVVYNKAL